MTKETFEVVIAAAQPYVDRTKEPPPPMEIARVTATVLDNPRKNWGKRGRAARMAVEAWLSEHPGHLRALNPTTGKGEAFGFLAVIEDDRPTPRAHVAQRSGPIAAARHPLLSKRARP